jgi:hypothetical protein
LIGLKETILGDKKERNQASERAMSNVALISFRSPILADVNDWQEFPTAPTLERRNLGRFQVRLLGLRG